MENNNKTLGIYFILGSAFFFSVMALFVKLGGDVPSIQKSFFRNFIASIFALVVIFRSRTFYIPNKDTILPLLLRAIFGTVGIFCNFYAIDHMNISDANILNKLSPFFAIIASYFLIKEKPGKVDWIVTVIAFIGAVFVAKPGYSIYGNAAIIAVMGGLFAGLAYTFVRILSLKNVPSVFIVFFFSFTSCIVSLVLCINKFVYISYIQLFWLIMSGFAAMGGQLCITKAYKYAPAKEISVFDYTQVVYSAVMGYLVFGEVSDIYSYIGYILIIGMALFKYNYNIRKS